MKIIQIFFALMISITTLESNSRNYLVHDWDSIYPPPRVELKYMGELFTRELIIKKSFRDNQLVPIQIELIKPEMENEHAQDLYLTVEHIEVIFAVEESVPRTRDNFKGHLVLIPLHWGLNFALEDGSRIVFNIKYNYNLNNKIVEAGEMTKEIRM
jgi:hypothetical protein